MSPALKAALLSLARKLAPVLLAKFKAWQARRRK